MNINRIQDTLKNIFQENNKRIIFWYDGEKEFEETLPSIQLDNVKIVRLDKISALALKIELECGYLDFGGLECSTLKFGGFERGDLKSCNLERGEPKQQYILYAPFHEPAPEDDWFFDIRLYSYTFHADRASIILKELNLENQSIRPFLDDRKAFFNSRDRFSRT